jgi:hypothetical protein
MKLLTLLYWFLGAGIVAFVASTCRVAWLCWLAWRDWRAFVASKRRWEIDPVRRMRR